MGVFEKGAIAASPELIGIGALIVLAYYLYNQATTPGTTVANAVQAVNPTNPNNAAYKATSSAAQAVTGDTSGGSLGTILYDQAHTGIFADPGNSITSTTPLPSTNDAGVSDPSSNYAYGA